MTYQRNHRISTRLYQSSAFPSFYARVVGKMSEDLVWGGLQRHFLENIRTGGTILEIGAGPGQVALKVVESRPDLTVIASDFSQQMLNLAEANLGKQALENEQIASAGTRLRFVQANAMDLSPFEGQTIDGVYSLGAIKHFPDPLQGLHQCLGVLQQGGIMYFTDFCADGTFLGTWELGKRFPLPALLKIALMPVLHLANKREAPSSHEVESWNKFLQSKGQSRVEYSAGKSMFSLIFEKGTCAGDT